MSENINISVILALGKTDKFTYPAIKSILDQTYVDFELILVVNGHDHLKVSKSLADIVDDSRVRIISTPLRGLSNALNLGLSVAKGNYIARMDADDISLPKRFEKQVMFLNSHPSYGVVGSRVQLIDENDSVLSDTFMFVENDKSIRRLLPIYNSLCHPALIFRREALIEVGGYKYGFMSEDHELFLRLKHETSWKFHNLPEVLFSYRRHQSQITSANTNRKNFIEIAAFLALNFRRYRDPRFLLGILYVHPLLQIIKKSIRIILRKT